jgi:hypothetical protein
MRVYNYSLRKGTIPCLQLFSLKKEKITTLYIPVVTNLSGAFIIDSAFFLSESLNFDRCYKKILGSVFSMEVHIDLFQCVCTIIFLKKTNDITHRILYIPVVTNLSRPFIIDSAFFVSNS